jgi:hypothetical protein
MVWSSRRTTQCNIVTEASRTASARQDSIQCANQNDTLPIQTCQHFRQPFGSSTWLQSSPGTAACVAASRTGEHGVPMTLICCWVASLYLIATLWYRCKVLMMPSPLTRCQPPAAAVACLLAAPPAATAPGASHASMGRTRPRSTTEAAALGPACSTHGGCEARAPFSRGCCEPKCYHECLLHSILPMMPYTDSKRFMPMHA